MKKSMSLYEEPKKESFREEENMSAINPFTDFGFKKIFGEEGNKDILIDFLNAVIKRDVPIAELTFGDKEKLGPQHIDRRVIYDIYCTDNNGSKFIVEMQNARQTYFKDRTIFYSTFPIRDQAKKGEWDFRLKPVYCISVLGFDTEKEDEKYYHEAKLKDQDNEVFYDKLTFIYLELPKFDLNEFELGTNVDKWLYFLKHLEDFNELPSILNQPIFRKAFEQAKESNLTPEELAAYEGSLKEYRDGINIVNTAVGEARRKEKTEGIKKVLHSKKILNDSLEALVQKQADLSILDKWFDVALEASSLDEFLELIGR